MKKVTDPNIISQLEGMSNPSPKKVVDPDVIRQLEGKPKIDHAAQFNPLMGMSPTGAPLPRSNSERNLAIGLASMLIPQVRAGELLGVGASGLARGAANLSGAVGENAAIGAGMSAADQDMEGSIGRRTAEGAVGGGLLGAAAHGIGAGLNALRPSKLFRGRSTPEELQEKLRLTQGTDTGLGDVLQNPWLKKQFENTLTSIPGTGANEALHDIGNQVVSRGEGLMGRLLGGKNPENVPEQINDLLTKSFKKSEKEKNALYKEFNTGSEEKKAPLDLSNFKDTLNKYIGSLKNSKSLDIDPDARSLLNKLTNTDERLFSEHLPDKKLKSGKFNPLSPEGLPTNKIVTEETNQLGADALPYIKTNEVQDLYHSNRGISPGSSDQRLGASALIEKDMPSFKEANLLKGKLRKIQQVSKASGDSYERGVSKIYGHLADSLKNDINSSLEKFGDKELHQSFITAEKNYGDNYARFDKAMHKFIGGKANPETIVDQFIKTSPTKDLANNIKALSDVLPNEEARKLLPYSYLASRAIDNSGKLNPIKMGEAIYKLKANQLKALIPDRALRNEFKDYSKLVNMNKESQNLMFNPKTGHRNLSILGPLSHVIGASIGAGTGSHEAGTPGAIGGAVVGAVAPSILGRYAVKALTSEELRKKLIERMINPKRLEGGDQAAGFAQMLRQKMQGG